MRERESVAYALYEHIFLHASLVVGMSQHMDLSNKKKGNSSHRFPAPKVECPNISFQKNNTVRRQHHHLVNDDDS